MAMRALRPLSLFIDEVKLINPANLDLRVKEGKNKDEINLLAQNFNMLMEHLEHAFVLQKTFVANASHELRTPVTRLMMSAELALQQERSKDDYRSSLESIIEDADNLEKIISSLLTLAQTDLDYSHASNQVPVRVDEMIWTLKEEWMLKEGADKFILTIKALPDEEEYLIINCNPTLLKIALDNIIANAYKFSEHQAVSCILEVSKRSVSISITDQGKGIDPQVKEHIFKPFFTSTSTPAQAGTGMGLYMAAKIITLYGGKITSSSGNNDGSTFLVVFERF